MDLICANQKDVRKNQDLFSSIWMSWPQNSDSVYDIYVYCPPVKICFTMYQYAVRWGWCSCSWDQNAMMLQWVMGWWNAQRWRQPAWNIQATNCNIRLIDVAHDRGSEKSSKISTPQQDWPSRMQRIDLAVAFAKHGKWLMNILTVFYDNVCAMRGIFC